MNSKEITNSQLLMTKPKTKTKKTQQITRTGIESHKWRSHGGLSAEGGGENGRKRYRK